MITRIRDRVLTRILRPFEPGLRPNPKHVSPDGTEHWSWVEADLHEREGVT